MTNRLWKCFIVETISNTVSDSTQLSSALNNDIDLIPFIGVQALTGSSKAITVCYEKISRVLFE